MSNEVRNDGVTVIGYEDLMSGKDLGHEINQAFGLNSLGLIVVNHVPKTVEKRKTLLPYGYQLAQLSAEEKERLTHAESFYSFGWSHGKEMFKGQPDYSKGSFYANPIHDVPYSDPELIKKFPTFCHPNIWPTEVLPGLEPAFKAAGEMIVDLGLSLMKHCDRHLRERHGFGEKDLLFPKLKDARTHKARLLYYFPKDAKDSKAEQSGWCGWHRDHGCLTGLFPAMYFDESGNLIKSPDPEAGLYIRRRNGDLVHIRASEDQVIFQMGETAQILSGGILQATPHYVRSPRSAQTFGRAAFAVFMGPEWRESLELPEQQRDLTQFWAKESPYTEFPSLAGRWEPGIDFEDFSVRTYKAYCS